ncbi:hypothetical protein DSO57_1037132 [Entomophthora muscae]|uniref:Uncharacterized protein n=1 Tax=Entomophthora muscae TaxID=34485 RepID=A0ACC2S0Y9_9FUNG|nr:hypothetical protein DSO57_1037132 [Entomophthora muscae]
MLIAAWRSCFQDISEVSRSTYLRHDIESRQDAPEVHQPVSRKASRKKIWHHVETPKYKMRVVQVIVDLLYTGPYHTGMTAFAVCSSRLICSLDFLFLR